MPINVMACSKVLVLPGDTYTSRLWCMWELCTLFSFTSMKQALDSVVVLPLYADGDVQKFARDLEIFDFMNASCYDPNEENKIFHAIKAVGGKRFNSRIHAMGKLMSATGAWHGANTRRSVALRWSKAKLASTRRSVPTSSFALKSSNSPMLHRSTSSRGRGAVAGGSAAN